DLPRLGVSHISDHRLEVARWGRVVRTGRDYASTSLWSPNLDEPLPLLLAEFGWPTGAWKQRSEFAIYRDDEVAIPASRGFLRATVHTRGGPAERLTAAMEASRPHTANSREIRSESGIPANGAAQESNLPSRGLHDRTGFEGPPQEVHLGAIPHG